MLDNVIRWFSGITGISTPFGGLSWKPKTFFDNLDGLYVGEAEGGTFQLCLKRFGNSVIGTLLWDNSPPEYHINLKGQVEPRQIMLTYSRNENHPNGSDHGEAEYHQETLKMNLEVIG